MTESRIEEVSGELSGMREQQGEMRQREIEEAFQRLLDDRIFSLLHGDPCSSRDDIALLKWALGVK